jgi:deazaflavin-dependent oxidoreductase (nitroreductase family)
MAGLRLERSGSPTGIKRLLFRSPIPLFRARLGFLLGRRFLMLEHTGRKSGQTRRTVLEVVASHPDAVYVAAAWGEKAQWLQNVRANAEVVVYHGSTRFRANAEPVTADEARGLMAEYARRYPRALGRLAAFMLDDPGKTPAEQAERVAAQVPMVRLPRS